MINKQNFLIFGTIIFIFGIIAYQKISFSSTNVYKHEHKTARKEVANTASAIPSIQYGYSSNNSSENQASTNEFSEETGALASKEFANNSAMMVDGDSTSELNEQSFNRIENNFYKRLEGTIGNDLNVTLHLIKVDGLLSGNYVYNNIGKPIHFDAESHIDEERKLILREFEFNSNGLPKITGIFKGKMLTHHWLKGNWEKPNSTISMPFSLRENYQAGSHRLWIEQQLQEHGICETEQCIKINLTYPQLIEGDEEQQRAIDRINQQIERNIIGRLSGSKKQQDELDINATIDALVANYQAKLENASEEVGNWRWEYEVKPNIFTNTYDLLSMGLAFYIYNGGEQDRSHYQCLNFDLSTGKPLVLLDVLNNRYHYPLNRKVLSKLKKTLGLSAEEDLADNDFYISDEDFTLTDNYSFSKGGITFYYNPNEIADRTYGTFEVFIPYVDIEEFVKGDGLLGEFK